MMALKCCVLKSSNGSQIELQNKDIFRHAVSQKNLSPIHILRKKIIWRSISVKKSGGGGGGES